ncbi:MAG TPA: indole-3-glycerol phosphate synthase TrpC [Vicinamibacteria bacterium]|nr:indole-3-glycerol phosphate synthase TrpC [Vicinamibacteria bacterium]
MSASVLGRIVARTRERLHERLLQRPLDEMLATAPTPGIRRPFREAVGGDGLNIIAEFKRRSPSKGALREDLTASGVAQAYEAGGARALSVLTEEDFFGGHLGDLRQARAATRLPTLRKDFLVDPYQVWEAWIAGADAVLLIVAALGEKDLRKLLDTALEAGLDPLVEVHDERELDTALTCGARLVGVNNRDLQTLEVSLDTALRIAPHIPDDVVAVAESGIATGADVRRLRDAGYDAFLVGEHFMTAPDPGQAVKGLIRDASAEGPA